MQSLHSDQQVGWLREYQTDALHPGIIIQTDDLHLGFVIQVDDLHPGIVVLANAVQA